MDELMLKLQEMRKSYIVTLSATFEIVNKMEENIINDSCNVDELKEFMMIIHKISGTSGILGISDLSEASSDLEIVIKKIVKAETDFGTEKPLVLTLLGNLKKVYKEINEG